MTVKFHGEVHEARKGKNDKGERAYTRVFKLETSLLSEDVFDVGSHASLPAIGQAYPRDPDSLCQSIDVQCVAGWKQWQVTAEYKVDEGSYVDPEDDTYKLSWSSEIYQEPAFRDADNKGMFNSAGDYYVDPPIQRDAAQLIAKFKKNYAVIPSFVLSLQNVVNDSSISIGGLSIDQYLAKMTRVEISEFKKRGNYKYYTVSYEIHIKKEGWRVAVLDAGLRQIDPDDDTKRIPCKDADDEPVTTAVALYGVDSPNQGQQLLNPTPDTAYFKEFKVYAEGDLSVLPGVS